MNRDNSNQSVENHENETRHEYSPLDREKVATIFELTKQELITKLDYLEQNHPELMSPIVDQLAHGYKVANVVGALEIVDEMSKKIFEY